MLTPYIESQLHNSPSDSVRTLKEAFRKALRSADYSAADDIATELEALGVYVDSSATAPLKPSTATIDAGRMLTLERRLKWQGLSLTVAYMPLGEAVTLHNPSVPGDAGILSERRLSRATGLSGADTGELCAWVASSMRDWADSGYPTQLPGFSIIGTWRSAPETGYVASLEYRAAEAGL